MGSDNSNSTDQCFHADNLVPPGKSILYSYFSRRNNQLIRPSIYRPVRAGYL